MPSALEAPPKLPRRVVPTVPLVVVTALCAALPVASALGAFRSTARAQARSEALELRVQYPRRTLFMERELLVLEVTARRACPALTATLAPGWLARFERHTVAEAEDALSFGALEAGATRRLSVELQAQDAGPAKGSLVLRCGGKEALEVPLSTFVFP